MANTEFKLGEASTRQMILVAGGALLAALFLFVIWYLVIRTPYEPAFTELKSADASIIIEELERQKTPYELTDNGGTIMVPKDKVDASRINILGGDLPLKGTVGFELFNQSDMGLTEFAQKINYQRALQGELARTLMALENIETARVHLSLPDSGIFERDKRAAKASVTIAPKLGKTVDAPTVTGIQRLIASAVPDLDTSNVAVLNAQGQLLTQDIATVDYVAEATLGSPIEQEYVMRVRDAIFPIISDPAVRITVRIAQNLKGAQRIQDEVTNLKEGTLLQPDRIDKQREFPIRISIILPREVSSQLHQSLIPLLVKNVEYDPTRGDSLTLLSSPPALPPSVTSAGIVDRDADVVENTDWTKGKTLLNSIWIWLMLAAVCLPFGYWVFIKITQKRQMTLGQRKAFSERLSLLLDEQGVRDSEAF
jgi:flagellar M-ring protein FliF